MQRRLRESSELGTEKYLPPPPREQEKKKIFRGKLSGRVRPRQGTEICNFGAPSPLEALHWIFCFFSSFYVQYSKTSPLKSGESSEKSSGENRFKSCHVCGCHVFFGPETLALSGPVLRDTARLSQRYPPIARYGVFGVSPWPNGCDTPSPFSERFPVGEHAKCRCDTPPLRRGISAILARYPMKTRQMGAIPPSAILSRKGIAR